MWNSLRQTTSAYSAAQLSGRLCKNLGTEASYCLCWLEAATFILMYLKYNNILTCIDCKMLLEKDPFTVLSTLAQIS